MASTLRLRRVAIQTYGEHVAFLTANCRLYKPESFKTIYRVVIAAADPAIAARIIATVNVVENDGLIGDEEVGLTAGAFAALGLPAGTDVTISLASPPASLDSVRRKISGELLSAQEIAAVIGDISAHRYTKIEIAAFLVSCAAYMTTPEVLAMTRAMAAAGTRLRWDASPARFDAVMDKHCIGGIPGNRTSMIVVPIVAAHGLPIPKTSSRAITSPSGTADTMEVLANVDVDTERMRAIVGQERGCLVWGGHVNLSPADDILISVERPLAIDTPEQMVASILSKKVAAGATHLVIDIPVGPTAKVRSAVAVRRLQNLFEEIGTAMGLTLTVMVTDGSQPVGRGIGPLLEARDVMAVLRNAPEAPEDLRERGLLLAARILEFDPAVAPGTGLATAQRLLASGAALAAMERICAAQGPAPQAIAPAAHVREIVAPRAGTVQGVDCLQVSRIARLAGAPTSKAAGIDLLRKVGDTVRAGEPLYRIHAAVLTDFDFAVTAAGHGDGYTIA
jgi:thymidine phosphorylase